jgi:Fungal specific transcription factor domain
MQISHSENGLWLQHLQGARDLIMYRGGPKSTDYLSRFFSLLDVSGSLFSGSGPLIEGNYWLEDSPSTPNGDKLKTGIQNWPAYDSNGVCLKLELKCRMLITLRTMSPISTI